MKKLNLLSIICIIAISQTSCNKDDDSSTPKKNYNNILSGYITKNRTLISSEIYTISGKAIVQSGVTLTIEPGTIIKGNPGEGTSASVLVIAKGGKIMAEGTADKPIIFTSIADNIQLNEKTGTNLTKLDNQLWGGIIILGDAKVSAENGDNFANIEGLPAEENYGAYGGTNDEDNSGVLKFISIRHGGISIGDGNEINGLTLGGVGNKTQISDIEIYATLDDGIECFGGSVNLSNILVYFQGDDGIDIDQNYSGEIKNFAVIQGDGISSDEGLEIDGPEGITYKNGLFKLTNGIIRNIGSEGSPADLKSNAQGTLKNITFQHNKKPIKIRTKFNENCTNKNDAYQNLLDNKLVASNLILNTILVYDGNANSENPTTCATELQNINTNINNNIQKYKGDGATLDIETLFKWTLSVSKEKINK